MVRITDPEKSLLVAISRGNLEAVKFLLNMGVIFTTDTLRQVAGVSCDKGYIEIVKLLEKSLNVNEILFYAVWYEKEELVKYLVNKGAIHYPALHYAVERHSPEFVEVLMGSNHGSLSNLLYSAAKGGNIPVMNYLINLGAGDFDSALLAAVGHCQLEASILLLEKGAKDYNFALRHNMSNNKQIEEILIAARDRPKI